MAAQRIAGGAAEQSSGGGVEHRDALVLIDADDGVQRGVDDRLSRRSLACSWALRCCSVCALCCRAWRSGQQRALVNHGAQKLQQRRFALGLGRLDAGNVHMKLSFSIGGKVSDTKEFDFGIREVASGLNRVGDECGRVYYVNGKRIFCKGGWIQPDILLEESEKRIYDEARLMAEANINLIGSEDMPSPSETWFESFDKYVTDVVACFLSMFPYDSRN